MDDYGSQKKKQQNQRRCGGHWQRTEEDKRPEGITLGRAFATSRKSQLEGLIQNGTFVTSNESKLDKSPQNFRSRLVDELKKVGSNLKKKSRLIAQNYADEGANTISTKAPTVQRLLQRVSLS